LLINTVLWTESKELSSLHITKHTACHTTKLSQRLFWCPVLVSDTHNCSALWTPCQALWCPHWSGTREERWNIFLTWLRASGSLWMIQLDLHVKGSCVRALKGPIFSCLDVCEISRCGSTQGVAGLRLFCRGWVQTEHKALLV